MHSEKDYRICNISNRFPDNNDKFKREEFVSQLSRQQEARVDWNIINEKYANLTSNAYMLSQINNIDQEIFLHLANLQISSGLQLAKMYNPQNKKALAKSKYRLRILAEKGYLVKHDMYRKRSSFPIYTLGPAGAKVLEIPYTINWWKKIDTKEALSYLITTQLFNRFRAIDKNAVFSPTPKPLLGQIIFKGNAFFVYVITNTEQDKKIIMLKNKRILAIAESLANIAKYIRNNKSILNMRYTTDFDLHVNELNIAFSKYNVEARELAPIEVPLFAQENDYTTKITKKAN